MEANAYSDLLEVYTRCDADECLCSDGRAHSAKTGYGQEAARLLGGGVEGGGTQETASDWHLLVCLLKLVQGDSLPPMWLQGDAQEVLEAESRNQSLGLHRLHASHRRQRSGPHPTRLQCRTHICSLVLNQLFSGSEWFCSLLSSSLSGRDSSGGSEEEPAVQVPPVHLSTHQLQKVNT